MPNIINPKPKNWKKEKDIFSLPNNPKALIIPAAASWAIKIVPIPMVVPNDFILSITVSVIIIPSAPPRR